MSLPRLTFLYPHLFKSLLPQEGTSRFQSLCPTPKRVQKAGFSTTPRQRQEIFAQRYGPATELPPPPPEGSKMPSRAQDDKSLAGAIEKEVKGGDRQEEKQPEPTPSEEAVRSKEAVTQADDGSRNESIETALQDPAQRASQLDASKAHSNEEGKPVYKDNAGLKTAKPLATVLEMPAPTVEKPDEHKAPHMQAPPYVHHFDMYTLVKNLGKGDFTEAQSITVMKAVRGLLGTNLEVAREGLVSKSDVENVCLGLNPAIPYNGVLTFGLAGNVPLPRRLLRTSHRDPQRPQILFDKNTHPTLTSPAQLRHPLPTRLARISSAQRRPPRHAERPPHGLAHAVAEPRWRDIRIELQDQRGVEFQLQE